MGRNHVIVDDRFAKYSKQTEAAISKSLVEAALIVQEAARGASSPANYNIGAIQAKTYAELHTIHTRKGLAVEIINRDFRGVFFEKGTYLSRSGALNSKTASRRQTGTGQKRLDKWGGNQGVRPQKFLRRGLAAGQRVLMERIRENLP